jgi:hypothetical protein
MPQEEALNSINPLNGTADKLSPVSGSVLGERYYEEELENHLFLFCYGDFFYQLPYLRNGSRKKT